MKNTNDKDTFESFADEDLVTFLKVNSPPPPQEYKPCEDLIMRSLFRESQQRHKNTQWYWLILPTAILTGILLISAHIFKPHSTPQMASEGDEEIEAFMINSWQGSMALSE